MLQDMYTQRRIEKGLRATNDNMTALDAKISRKLSVILAEVRSYKHAAQIERSVNREMRLLWLMIDSVVVFMVFSCLHNMIFPSNGNRKVDKSEMQGEKTPEESGDWSAK